MPISRMRLRTLMAVVAVAGIVFRVVAPYPGVRDLVLAMGILAIVPLIGAIWYGVHARDAVEGAFLGGSICGAMEAGAAFVALCAVQDLPQGAEQWVGLLGIASLVLLAGWVLGMIVGLVVGFGLRLTRARQGQSS